MDDQAGNGRDLVRPSPSLRDHTRSTMRHATSDHLKPFKILVVDDERGARMALEVPLRLSGYDVIAVSDGREAIELGQKNRFDVVLTDVFMRDVGGLDVVREFRRFSPDTRIVVLTAQGSLEIAFEAIEQGADDFLAKPFDTEQVLAVVRRATERPQPALPKNEPEPARTGIIGHSPEMVRTYKLISHAARTEATVLIEGESGTGKELAARAIHSYSRRAGHPFTAINCSSLTETLLESELFGYVKGSFTGATSDRQGLFESTNGGTILLDELGSTSPSFQASLLRVLQEREVRRVGEREARRVDVRIIGATNTDIEESVHQQRFRADLFYRLSVLKIKLPPLRERGAEDIELLARHFLRKYSGESERQLTDEVLDALSRYAWPGNVRELENTIQYAVAVSSNHIIAIHDLPEQIIQRVAPMSSEPSGAAPLSLADDRPTLDEVSRRYIRMILSEAGGNKSRAAEILGINRRTLYRYLEPTESDSGEEDQPGDCL